MSKRRAWTVDGRDPQSIVFWAFMAVALIAAAAMFWTTETRPPSSNATGCDRNPIPVGAKVSIVGDSYSTGQKQGGVGEKGWPALLGTATGWDITTVAVGGSGFLSRGFDGVNYSGPTFLEQAEQAAGADLIIIFGGRNDVMHYGSDASYAERVTQTVQAAAIASPDARIVVFTSPLSPNLDVEGLAKVNGSITNAVNTFPCVELVNTVDLGWFTGNDLDLIGVDGIHPTDAGHAYMESRMAGVLADLRVL